jgi:hypothetical protein
MTAMKNTNMLLAGLGVVLAGSVTASTTSAWMAVDKASEAACRKASGFPDAVAGPPIHFSDRFLVDARLVKGTYPQAHMKGAKGAMLCLYNRRTKRTEVQDARMEPIMPAASTLRDVMWKGAAINGQSPVEGSRISLMLDSGGRVGGRSSAHGSGNAVHRHSGKGSDGNGRGGRNADHFRKRWTDADLHAGIRAA